MSLVVIVIVRARLIIDNLAPTTRPPRFPLQVTDKKTAHLAQDPLVSLKPMALLIFWEIENYARDAEV
jgi:hypothetical protein